MLTSSVARNQFEEWMDDYHAKLREGVQKRFGITDDRRGNDKQNDALPRNHQEESSTS
jgi:hypothetical protein